MIAAPARDAATIADYLAQPEDRKLELIRGTLLDRPEATGEHAVTQSSTVLRLGAPFQRKPGNGGPGGWWFFTELEVQLGAELFRPDVCGFRRERMATPTTGRPCIVRPDWICEVLSPSNPERDRVDKLRSYFAAGVPHYWVIDPVAGTLEVFRRIELAYALVLTGRRGEHVRPEPFDAVSFRVEDFLGADPE